MLRHYPKKKNKMIKMGKEDKDKEQPLTIEAKNKLLLIDNIVRMNSDYTLEELETADIPTLEALYQAEKIREKANKKEDPKPTFIKAPIKHKPADIKIEKKENQEKEEKGKFNTFEVFKPQYIHPARLVNNKFSEDSEILTMRTNINPKFPEWQVS